jgi:Protein of unknown function (DUF2510)
MYEFDSISVSSYEASSLAGKLTERSGDGWDVVAIVPAGSEITAYLRRASSGDTATARGDTGYAASSTSSADTTGAGVTAGAGAATEPAGWGTAPEPSTTTTPTSSAGGWGATTSAAQQQPSSTPPTTPSVPAGWYNDPAGRYELRYWDGSAWTEHVSRAGQQYTDPPVP